MSTEKWPARVSDNHNKDKTSMRIGVDARPLAHGTTGIGRYLRNLLPLLIDSQHEWYLYCDRPIDVGDMPVKVRSGRVQSRGLSTPFAQFVFPIWALLDRLDMFWSPRHHLPLLRSSCRSVVTVHDLVWRRVPETMSSGGRLVESLLMPRTLQKTDLVFVPSQATAADIEEYMPELTAKVVVTPLGPSLTDTRSPRLVESNYGLMVCSLEPRKNIDRVIDAYLMLRQELELDFKILIAGGPGWKSSKLHARLKQLPGDWVQYLGPVGDDVLQRLYQQCRFVIAPSLHEGFGLSILEGFVFGKPVLTSNVSSMPEVAGDAAVYVDPFDVQDIARGMKRLILDECLVKKLEGRARVRAKMYSWKDTAKATRLALEQVMR